MIPYAETKYGFNYGAAKVTRICSDEKKGWIVLGLETPRHKGHEALQIYVTRTGRVRVSTPSGEWLPKKRKSK